MDISLIWTPLQYGHFSNMDTSPIWTPLQDGHQGCIFFYNPPTPGGKESKGLRAREENQRRVEKMERQREKKRKISVGNS
jgi:hypothetical protein